MPIGQDQTTIGDKTGRTARRQAHSRLLNLAQPRLIGGKTMGRFHFGGWERIKCPHAFIGEGGAGKG